MENTFTKLADTNLDNYNQHPVAQTLVVLAVGIAGVVAVNAVARHFVKKQIMKNTGGNYHG